MHDPQVVFEAIRRNKHVITANKALVAAYLDDIQELLKEHPGVTFGYEAAVCGGERRPTPGRFAAPCYARSHRLIFTNTRSFVDVNAAWLGLASFSDACVFFFPCRWFLRRLDPGGVLRVWYLIELGKTWRVAICSNLCVLACCRTSAC